MGMLMHMTMLEQMEKQNAPEQPEEQAKIEELPFSDVPAEETPIEEKKTVKPTRKPVKKAPVRRSRK